MKKLFYYSLFLLCILLPCFSFSQSIEDAPKRAMAEWEEIQALLISWDNPEHEIFIQIVEHARQECEVIIVCNSEFAQISAEYYLNSAGIDISQNVSFFQTPINDIWVRDYGPNSVYVNEVDSLVMVDWIYNRNRPKDDAMPVAVAAWMGIPLLETVDAPNDLVNTGGNFMTDGLGTAFCSELVLEENGPGNEFGESNHSEEAIDEIMYEYMGIHNYIKMETLEYDDIHHIDMHMKLLDETTLLVGEYPEGIADHDQIEANLQYVLDTFHTAYGEPFEVIRIPMPGDSDNNGEYPDEDGRYLTYTNATFVNNTVLVPTYDEPEDETALAIWADAMPGYNIQGINCDDIIGSYGALHCITKEVGVESPLLITHNRIRKACSGDEIQIEAQVQAKDSITNVAFFYRTDDGAFNMLNMEILVAGLPDYAVELPAFEDTLTVQYYIQATTASGKVMHRPMPAPEGYYSIVVENCTYTSITALEAEATFDLLEAFPNPASAITCIPVQSKYRQDATLSMYDVMGQKVASIFKGALPTGASKYFIHANNYPAGTYVIHLATANAVKVQKLVIE